MIISYSWDEQITAGLSSNKWDLGRTSNLYENDNNFNQHSNKTLETEIQNWYHVKKLIQVFFLSAILFISKGMTNLDKHIVSSISCSFVNL